MVSSSEISFDLVLQRAFLAADSANHEDCRVIANADLLAEAIRSAFSPCQLQKCRNIDNDCIGYVINLRGVFYEASEVEKFIDDNIACLSGAIEGHVEAGQTLHAHIGFSEGWLIEQRWGIDTRKYERFFS
jgi:hypothetical protein